jgi:hypothetical protein
VHERHRSLYPSPSRSPHRLSKCRKEKRLNVTRRSIWARDGSVLGWRRPHSCARFRAQSDSWVAPAQVFGEKRAAGRRVVHVLLAIQKSYELLANYGCSAREICDKCGIVLGAVRFTQYGESEVCCSRERRGDAHRSATLRPGHPRKCKNDRERRAAKTRQQQVYRSLPKVEKTVPIQSETKGLQRQKSPLSYLGTPGPAEPLISSPRT